METTHLNVREKSKADTRQRLIQAALDLFSERGFTKTRAADIAERAGVAVGSLYMHFGDKEGLLRTILTDTAKAVHQQVAQFYQAQPHPDENLARNHIAALVDVFMQRRQILQIGFNSDVSGTQAIVDAMESIALQVENSIRHGQAIGVYRKDIDPRLAARAEIGMNVSLLYWWIAHPTEASREQIIDTLAKMRASGLHASS